MKIKLNSFISTVKFLCHHFDKINIFSVNNISYAYQPVFIFQSLKIGTCGVWKRTVTNLPGQFLVLEPHKILYLMHTLQNVSVEFSAKWLTLFISSKGDTTSKKYPPLINCFV